MAPSQRPWSSVSEEEVDAAGMVMVPSDYVVDDYFDDEDCYDEDELEELEEVGELVSVSERLAPSSVASSSVMARPVSTTSVATSTGTAATIVRLRAADQNRRNNVILYDKTPAYGVIKVIRAAARNIFCGLSSCASLDIETSSMLRINFS